MTRPSGATTAILDKDLLLELARTELTAQFPGADPEHLTHGPQPQMLFAVDRGNGCVVNGEGVGAVADENDRIEIYFTYGAQWLPIALDLPAVGRTVTGDRLDLAYGIRTFGARLDSNHYQWFRRYDKDNSTP